jgi:hypothetical protein
MASSNGMTPTITFSWSICAARYWAPDVIVAPQQDERAEHAHLGLEQPVRVGGLGALEGVGADQLTEPIGLVRGRRADGAHLVEHDVMPAFGQLPRRLRAREATADDINGGRATVVSSFGTHSRKITPRRLMRPMPFRDGATRDHARRTAAMIRRRQSDDAAVSEFLPWGRRAAARSVDPHDLQAAQSRGNEQVA